MPIFKYDKLSINYTQTGGGTPLLFLHGWGANCESFNCLTTHLKNNYEIIALDFPGFGASDKPDRPWSLDDYVNMTEAFIKELKLTEFIPIGHSFGGRVALRLSQRFNYKKLVLIDSAGIKPKRKSDYYLKVYGYKLFKNIARIPVLSWILKEPLEAYRHKYSSSDYKNADVVMKQTLSKVVNEDLTYLLPKITASTLLIWGSEDDSTPLEDGKTMEKLIPDAGLVIFDGAGHFSYLEEPERTLIVLNSFLGG